MTDILEQGTCEPAATVTLMPEADATSLATVLKALADPARVRVLAYLAATPEGTVCSCHLPDHLGISQPTLSHHLKKLADAGLVTREKRGRWAHYAVDPVSLEPLQAYLRSVQP
ncbi:metalloregulator ArsR/SmtB family transcription factor [Glutamicibacter protophormiae]|nr:metalloregulator ArsR/SmtB family transcription factor [Glutamicibacter protophormiae]